MLKNGLKKLKINIKIKNVKDYDNIDTSHKELRNRYTAVFFAEQLCCTDILSGKGSVGSRRLTSMFVCEYCSYLFATGEALDRHRLTCFGPEDFYPVQSVRNIFSTRSFMSFFLSLLLKNDNVVQLSLD